MKNLIVANFRPKGRVDEQHLRALIDAQIENSLSLGWCSSDLYVVTNLDVTARANIVRTPLNDNCLTGSKMFALEHLFSIGAINGGEIWWSHDLDAWQNFPMEVPHLADIGLAEYSTPKFNGGSVMLREESRDLILAITGSIRKTSAPREEPTINRILRNPSLKSRVTTLNSTFNVGCSAYAVRYERSDKPVLVSHFHPRTRSAWRTHVAGCNKIGKVSVSPRLTEILVRHFHGGVFPLGEWQTKPIPQDSSLKEV